MIVWTHRYLQESCETEIVRCDQAKKKQIKKAFANDGQGGVKIPNERSRADGEGRVRGVRKFPNVRERN
jgi:hypothetical protein